MARFTGEVSDFEKFIGPHLRNLVQNSITRKYRKKIGKCENCGSTEKLDSAHIHGKDRKTLIKKAYHKYLYSKDELLDVDLNQFVLDFKKLHFPLEETFRILCRDCHIKHDKKTEKSKNLETENNIESFKNYQTLEIELDPNDDEKFKKLFLLHKSAIIKITYFDNSTKIREWKLIRFKDTSGVIRNLRSRPEFRQGVWQKSKIKKVEVEINYKK